MRWLSLAMLAAALIGLAYFADRRLPGILASDPGTVDRVVVEKSERQLILYSGTTPIREYSVVLGQNAEGHKRQAGDSRTPEGHYVLDWRNRNSRFYRSLHVSYPNETDTATAAAAGLSPGANIMVHGLPNGLGWLGPLMKSWDWTDGCIAVTNREMEEIWRAVPDGAPIEIKP